MRLVIGGFQPFSTVDYPGKLSAVVFLQGCSWRCPYCHNKALQPFDRQSDAPAWESILEVLKARRGQLDAVVFSGGEPTAQGDELLGAVQQVTSLGFKAGLHTSGSYPINLACFTHLFDWIALDVKVPFESYRKRLGVGGGVVLSSLEIILVGKKRPDIEVRTTWDSTLLDLDDAAIMAREIAECGAPSWTIQRCTGDTTDLEAVAQAARAAGTGMEIKVRG